MFYSSLKRSFEISPNGSPDHLPAAVSFPVTSLPVSFSLRFSFLSQTLLKLSPLSPLTFFFLFLASLSHLKKISNGLLRELL